VAVGLWGSGSPRRASCLRALRRIAIARFCLFFSFSFLSFSLPSFSFFLFLYLSFSFFPFLYLSFSFFFSSALLPPVDRVIAGPAMPLAVWSQNKERRRSRSRRRSRPLRLGRRCSPLLPTFRMKSSSSSSPTSSLLLPACRRVNERESTRQASLWWPKTAALRKATRRGSRRFWRRASRGARLEATSRKEWARL